MVNQQAVGLVTALLHGGQLYVPGGEGDEGEGDEGEDYAEVRTLHSEGY